jgi:hypothetical protein
MTNPRTEYEIVINNEKIHSFYKEHPRINIEQANLLLIDFFDKVYNHITEDLESNINAQLLSYMNENKKEMETIKTNIAHMNETLSKTNSDIMNNMIVQLANIKKDYLDDVKAIMNNNTLTLNDKMSSILDKNNSHLIDKTTLIINEVLPKNQDQLIKELQLNFRQFHTMITEDTSKIAKACSNEKSMNEFIAQFESKYSTMLQTVQQPLFTFLTASEDRISKNIDGLKEISTSSSMSQKPILDELGEFLGKYNVSSNKGKYGEQNLSSILNTLYQSAEIKDTSGTKASGDFIMRRLEKPPILFENKEYKANIDKDEIAKFIRDIDVQNVNGIFISQYSGIAFKQNYQIDVHKGNVLVYIQNCEYSLDKIRIAVDIIDSLAVKIQELNIDDSNNISKEMLDDINSEYQAFILQKENMIMMLKDFQKRMTSQIEDLKMPVLDKYLEPKYAYVKSNSFVCDLCNTFNTNNKQSLSAHKRGCKKKFCQTIS